VNWNQIACVACWNANNPGREPFRAIGVAAIDGSDHCSWCGNPTNSGIFVRADPRIVPFPQPDDQD